MNDRHSDKDEVVIDIDSTAPIEPSPTPPLVRDETTTRPNAADFMDGEGSKDDALREEVFLALDELKKKGAKFRLPKRNQPVKALQKRLQEIRGEFAKSKKAPAPTPVADKPKAANKPKDPPANEQPRRVRHRPTPDDEHKSAADAEVPMTWLHAAVYGGANLLGTAATFAELEELEDYGDNVWSNRAAFNPVITEVAKELGIDMDMPVPATVKLSMMLVGTAAGTYLIKHPENPAAMPTLMALRGFMQVTIVAGEKKKKKASADSSH